MERRQGIPQTRGTSSRLFCGSALQHACYSAFHFFTRIAARWPSEQFLANPETHVEEFLRCFSFVPPPRRATLDIEFHGCPVRKGDGVVLPLSAPHRPDQPASLSVSGCAGYLIRRGRRPTPARREAVA